MVKQIASTDHRVHAPAPEVGSPSIPAPTYTGNNASAAKNRRLFLHNKPLSIRRIEVETR